MCIRKPPVRGRGTRALAPARRRNSGSAERRSAASGGVGRLEPQDSFLLGSQVHPVESERARRRQSKQARGIGGSAVRRCQVARQRQRCRRRERQSQGRPFPVFSLSVRLARSLAPLSHSSLCFACLFLFPSVYSTRSSFENTQ